MNREAAQDTRKREAVEIARARKKSRTYLHLVPHHPMNAGIINNQSAKLPAGKNRLGLTIALPPVFPANGPLLDFEVLKAINGQDSNALHGRLWAVNYKHLDVEVKTNRVGAHA